MNFNEKTINHKYRNPYETDSSQTGNNTVIYEYGVFVFNEDNGYLYLNYGS